MVSPFWTAADDAELGVLVNELVDGAFAHRDRCSICRLGGPWCESLRTALEVVLDWRERRILRSRAVVLRRRQDLLDSESEEPWRATG